MALGNRVGVSGQLSRYEFMVGPGLSQIPQPLVGYGANFVGVEARRLQFYGFGASIDDKSKVLVMQVTSSNHCPPDRRSWWEEVQGSLPFSLVVPLAREYQDRLA